MNFDKSRFPHLAEGFVVTSPATREYNCIAWAAGVSDEWWDPSPDGKWPPQLERNDSLITLIALYEQFGFVQCDHAEAEEGFEKIAIYGDDTVWTHAARQLPDGRWTSKLGSADDISHDSLGALESDDYGRVVAILRRAMKAAL